MITVARAVLVYLVVLFITISVGILFMSKAEARAGVIVYDVIDIAVAARVVTSDETNLLCLITPEGHGFTKNPKKWKGFSCVKLGVEPFVWKFCRGNPKKLYLLCVTPGTIINGVVESADPGNEPKIRMQMREYN